MIMWLMIMWLACDHVAHNDVAHGHLTRSYMASSSIVWVEAAAQVTGWFTHPETHSHQAVTCIMKTGSLVFGEQITAPGPLVHALPCPLHTGLPVLRPHRALPAAHCFACLKVCWSRPYRAEFLHLQSNAPGSPASPPFPSLLPHLYPTPNKSPSWHHSHSHIPLLPTLCLLQPGCSPMDHLLDCACCPPTPLDSQSTYDGGDRRAHACLHSPSHPGGSHVSCCPGRASSP